MLTGVRYAIAAAWGLDVAAEFTGSQQGLGYLMIVHQESLDTAGIILIVLIFCALAIIADRLVRFATRRLTRWSGRDADTGMVREMLGGA
jgi:ABC-type nitrate/sulfonate/bicarbonate transport system permease component